MADEKVTAPAWLNAAGKKKYRELAARYPQIHANNPDELGMLADAWSTYLMAVADIQAMGLMIRSGERVWNNPAVNTKEQERKAAIKLATILGIIKDDQDEDAPSPLKALIENRG